MPCGNARRLINMFQRTFSEYPFRMPKMSLAQHHGFPLYQEYEFIDYDGFCYKLLNEMYRNVAWEKREKVREIDQFNIVQYRKFDTMIFVRATIENTYVCLR